MATENQDNYNVKKFIKHVILAAKRQEDSIQAKKALEKQITKLKNVSLSKQSKNNVQKELEKLEQKLNEVLEKEGKIMVANNLDSNITSALKSEIEKLENQINSLKEKDSLVIDYLKTQIDMIKENYDKEKSTNKLELENTSKAIIDLRERIKRFMESREEREKKMEEIEKKIKEKVSKNYDEIVKIEKQIMDMEERYELISKQGKYDRSILQEVENKISSLKQRLIMKKAGVPDKEEEFVPEIKVKEKKSLLFMKRSVPMKKRLFIRHDLQIKPIEKERLPQSLPPLPPLPRKVDMPDLQSERRVDVCSLHQLPDKSNMDNPIYKHKEEDLPPPPSPIMKEDISQYVPKPKRGFFSKLINIRKK